MDEELNIVISASPSGEASPTIDSPASAPASRPQTPEQRRFMNQVTMRKAIQLIQSDQSLTASDKARRIQDLMDGGGSLRRTHSLSSVRSASPALSAQSQDSIVFPAIDRAWKPGCSHYRRGCRVLAQCCNEWVACRHCHNAQHSEHEINHRECEHMLCLYCFTPQKSSQHCFNCKRSLGVYFCPTCKLWEDNQSHKNVFHCDKCGICRAGPSQAYKHCDTCKTCLPADLKHKCIENGPDCDCPICGEYLRTSSKAVRYMDPCMHPIHDECYQRHINSGSYQCPLCFKSVIDTWALFTQIDMMMATEQMPPEYIKQRAYIFCNDCERKTWTQYHFIYLKCKSCSSYNTKLLRTADASTLVSQAEREHLEAEAADENAVEEGQPRNTSQSALGPILEVVGETSLGNDRLSTTSSIPQ